jgi:hypothetical protein
MLYILYYRWKILLLYAQAYGFTEINKIWLYHESFASILKKISKLW